MWSGSGRRRPGPRSRSPRRSRTAAAGSGDQRGERTAEQGVGCGSEGCSLWSAAVCRPDGRRALRRDDQHGPVSISRNSGGLQTGITPAPTRVTACQPAPIGPCSGRRSPDQPDELAHQLHAERMRRGKPSGARRASREVGALICAEAPARPHWCVLDRHRRGTTPFSAGAEPRRPAGPHQGRSRGVQQIVVPLVGCPDNAAQPTSVSVGVRCGHGVPHRRVPTHRSSRSDVSERRSHADRWCGRVIDKVNSSIDEWSGSIDLLTASIGWP